MTEKHTSGSNHDSTVHHGTIENSHDGHKGGGNKNLIAIFSYLWILIIIPLLTDAKNDPFVKYHLKQGLALILFGALGWIVGFVIGWVPVLGGLITFLWWLFSVVFAIIGIINVLNGEEKELPLIGHYAKKFTF